MDLQFGNYAYFFYPVLFILLAEALFFLFRKSGRGVKQAVVFIIMLLNVGQHLFKFWVWPHKFGQSFNIENTATNMCALLILISPLFHFSKNEIWKTYISFAGTFAGFGATVYPYWVIGQNVFAWEPIRFFVCHGLLFLSSILPLLWGLRTVRIRFFPFYGFIYLLSLVLILANDVICISAGLAEGKEDLYGTLYTQNHLWIMHPPEVYPFVYDILSKFVPEALIGNATTPAIPLLWYAIPIYLGISLLGLLIGVLFSPNGIKKLSRKNREGRAKRGEVAFKRKSG